MKRVLLVVPWDPQAGHNARSANLHRLFAAAGHESVLLCRKTHASHTFRDLVRDSLSFGASVTRNRNASVIAVDHFLNYAPGVRSDMELETTESRPHGLKHLLIRVISPLGLLRDLIGLISLGLYAQFRVPGSFDWCLGFDAGGAGVAWLLRKTGKVRLFVYEDQDYGPIGGRLRRVLTTEFEKFLLRRAGLIVSVGFRLANLRRSQTKKPCYVVHNGVSVRMFHIARDKTAATLPTLVFAGNIHPWDGLDLAIDALPQICAQAGPVRLLIVGGGPRPLMERLRNMAAEKDVFHLVHFLGPRPNEELPEIFKQAHIGLAHFQGVPFRVFSFPLKVIEYMAAGLPVIATQNTEAGDLVERFQCGRSIPFTAHALADAVTDLLLDRQQYGLLQSNAIHHSDEFDWKGLFEREFEIISSHDRH